MKHGFNILEVVLATGLLAVIFLGVMSIFLAFHGSNRYSAVTAQAIDVAGAELSRTKTLPYETLEGYVDSPPALYAIERQGIPYNVTISAERLDYDAAQPDYKLLRLAVRLTWKQRKSIDRQDETQAALREVITSTELVSVVGPEARL